MPVRIGMSCPPSVKLADIRGQELQLARQVRELKKQMEPAGPRPPTPRMQAVALRIFVISKFDVSVPLQYLRFQGRRADEADVRGWYAALSAGDRECLLLDQGGQPPQIRQLAEARKFLAERDIALWVQQQNRQKSIAPTPGAVLEQFPAELAPGSSDPCSKRRRLGRIMS